MTHGTLDEVSQPDVRPGCRQNSSPGGRTSAAAESQLIASQRRHLPRPRRVLPEHLPCTAAGGYGNSMLANLLRPANQAWSLGAGVTQPIFQGGALLGQSPLLQVALRGIGCRLPQGGDLRVGQRGGRAHRRAAEPASSSSGSARAATQAERAYRFAQAQMRAGTISVLTLLNTQTALFSTRDALAQAKFAHLQALVGLYPGARRRLAGRRRGMNQRRIFITRRGPGRGRRSRGCGCGRGAATAGKAPEVAVDVATVQQADVPVLPRRTRHRAGPSTR